MLKKIAFATLCASLFAGIVPAMNAQQRFGNKPDSAAESSRRETIIIRCTYWARPQNAEPVPPLFYRDGNDYLPFIITEMAFVKAYEYHGSRVFKLYRKATEEEIEQRKSQGLKKSEREYIEYAQIEIPPGLKDVGVLIPGSLKTAKPRVFNFDESFFPKGSTMIYNLSPTPFRMGFAPQKSREGAMEPQSAELQPGTFWVTRPVKTDMRLNVRVAVPVAKEIDPKGWKTVYSSSGMFLPTTRSVFFALPSAKTTADGAPRIEFRQLSVVPKPPPPPPKVSDDKPDGKKSKKSRDGKKSPDGKKPESPRRRV